MIARWKLTPSRQSTFRKKLLYSMIKLTHNHKKYFNIFIYLKHSQYYCKYESYQNMLIMTMPKMFKVSEFIPQIYLR